jgi:hypothetical protein
MPSLLSKHQVKKSTKNVTIQNHQFPIKSLDVKKITGLSPLLMQRLLP